MSVEDIERIEDGQARERFLTMLTEAAENAGHYFHALMRAKVPQSAAEPMLVEFQRWYFGTIIDTSGGDE